MERVVVCIDGPLAGSVFAFNSEPQTRLHTYPDTFAWSWSENPLVDGQRPTGHYELAGTELRFVEARNG